MISERNQAKKSNNFDLADKIREDLLSKGISIEDLKDKTVWKLK
jgi:cysteinyl-tRNA synthetase